MYNMVVCLSKNIKKIVTGNWERCKRLHCIYQDNKILLFFSTCVSGCIWVGTLGFVYFLFPPDIFNIVSFSYSLMIVGEFLSTGGIHQTVFYEVTKKPLFFEYHKEIVSSGILGVMCVSLCSLGIIFVLHWCFPLIKPLSMLVYIGLSFPFLACNKVYLWFLNGALQFKKLALYRSLRYALIFLSLLFFYFLSFPSQCIFLIFIVPEIILCVVLTIKFRSYFSSCFFPCFKNIKKYLFFGLMSHGSQSLMNVNMKLGVLFIPFLSISTISASVCNAVFLIVDGLYQVLQVCKDVYAPQIFLTIQKRGISTLKKFFLKICVSSGLFFSTISILVLFGVSLFSLCYSCTHSLLPHYKDFMGLLLLCCSGLFICSPVFPFVFLVTRIRNPYIDFVINFGITIIHCLFLFLLSYIGIFGIGIALLGYCVLLVLKTMIVLFYFITTYI